MEDDLSLPALNTATPPPVSTSHVWVNGESVLIGCKMGEVRNDAMRNRGSHLRTGNGNLDGKIDAERGRGGGRW